MSHDNGSRMPRVKIVSGDLVTMERELNTYYDDYSVYNFTYTVVKDVLIMTCILILKSEVQKQRAGGIVRPGLMQ